MNGVLLTLRTWRFSANPITDGPLEWTNQRATSHSPSRSLIGRLAFWRRKCLGVFPRGGTKTATTNFPEDTDGVSTCT
ncbi:unnamed protein product [Pleuronectes platessa]|uniref:Uncharacterized protein n=1 Tax=Pleuronectes platessa TaxID=8262 RepID=A0A9N7UFH4_PLEPL|nr:unnamed protein product [Pleuronectes platessa]